MKTFTRLFERFDDIMSAVTFAQAGEYETARELLHKPECTKERISIRRDRDVRVATKSARK